jgi:crossover junction endodeoxyribonuclease RuvC
MSVMRALGIDPGTVNLGWGIVDREGNRLVHVAHGVIALDADEPLSVRLVGIADGLEALIEKYAPTVGAVESTFFNKDAQAAAKLGHARGVAMLCLGRARLHVGEYPPARVKQTVVGSGRAEKRQVAAMVKALLGLSSLPPLDAADALAVSITHLRIGPVAERLSASARSLPPRLAAALKLHKSRGKSA